MADISERIENDFKYHAPDEERIERHEAIRARHRHLAREIVALVPPGREQSLALTSLEESRMWANAGIARAPKT